MSLLRKTIFWIHLVVGFVTGLVILMMSITGVLLTYEKQMISWADRGLYTPRENAGDRLPLQRILVAVAEQDRGAGSATLVISSGPAAPVQVELGRGRSLFVDPYTGEILGEGARGIRNFFQTMTGWHRWFNAGGENRQFARAVTGAGNLAFLFLIFSGLYLWLPRRWKWNLFRNVLFFNPNATTAKARDYNWHHVFGIWSSIPLAIVIATAVVISYTWAGNMVYLAFGEEPPAGRRGPPGIGIPVPEQTVEDRTAGSPAPLSLDELLMRAAVRYPDWRTIRIGVPASQETPVFVAVDLGNGGQPQLRYQLALDRYTGAVLNSESFADRSPGGRMRTIIRFAHTGEVLGLTGQTIAGLVSLVSIIMVWTGFALAYRRLIVPLLKRRNS